MYEAAACHTYLYEAAASAGCWWEVAELVVRAGLCVVELYGFGKFVKGRKIMKQAEELEDAVKRAENMREATRAMAFGILAIVAGDCFDFALAVRDLVDCLFSDDVASLSVRRRAGPVFHPMPEGVVV